MPRTLLVHGVHTWLRGDTDVAEMGAALGARWVPADPVPPPWGRFEPCTNVTAEVYLRAYLSPCINDCGIYGQCKLLRTNNYLYAACECKAGEITPPSSRPAPPRVLGGGLPAAPLGAAG